MKFKEGQTYDMLNSTSSPPALPAQLLQLALIWLIVEMQPLGTTDHPCLMMIIGADNSVTKWCGCKVWCHATALTYSGTLTTREPVVKVSAAHLCFLLLTSSNNYHWKSCGLRLMELYFHNNWRPPGSPSLDKRTTRISHLCSCPPDGVLKDMNGPSSPTTASLRRSFETAQENRR